MQALDPENDRLLVTALFEQLADYVMLETGEAPSPETIDEFFYDRPPSVEAVDKLLFVIRDGEGKPVGLIDLLRNYPEPSDWYLGFLGIVLDKRGLGLGNAAVNLLKEMVHE
ncbi:MAG: GNAT family N-acetyltransferase, partial [Mangrovicoccus sp.]